MSLPRTISPTQVSLSLGTYPVKQGDFQGVWEVPELRGSVETEIPLNLTYENIPTSIGVQFLASWASTGCGFFSMALPPAAIATVVDPTLRTFLLSNPVLVWAWAAPPSYSAVKNGLVTVTVPLVAELREAGQAPDGSSNRTLVITRSSAGTVTGFATIFGASTRTLTIEGEAAAFTLAILGASDRTLAITGSAAGTLRSIVGVSNLGLVITRSSAGTVTGIPEIIGSSNLTLTITGSATGAQPSLYDPQFETTRFGHTISGGNKVAEKISVDQATIVLQSPKSSGKWYVEFVITGGTNPDTCMFGLATQGDDSVYLGAYATGFGYDGSAFYSNGLSGTSGSGTRPTVASGDRVGIAFDMDAKKFWVNVNGVYSGSGDPATGTDPNYAWTSTHTFTPALRIYWLATLTIQNSPLYAPSGYTT